MSPDIAVAFILYRRSDQLESSISAFDKFDRLKYYFFIDFCENDPLKQDTLCNKINDIMRTSNRSHIHFEVIKRVENIGLRENITQAINHVTKEAPKFIVLEDDLKVTECAAHFVIHGLDMIRENNLYTHVSACTFKNQSVDLYYVESNFFHPWMWGSISERWPSFTAIENCSTIIIFLRVFSKFGYRGLYYLNIYRKRHNIGVWNIQWNVANWFFDRRALLPSLNLVENLGGDQIASNTSEVVQEKIGRPRFYLKRIQKGHDEIFRLVFNHHIKTSLHNIVKALKKL